jgi:hypothetical protein
MITIYLFSLVYHHKECGDIVLFLKHTRIAKLSLEDVQILNLALLELQIIQSIRFSFRPPFGLKTLKSLRITLSDWFFHQSYSFVGNILKKK